MANGKGTTQVRERAWVLLQVGDPTEVAAALHKQLGLIGEDDWVVIRADVVVGLEGYITLDYNIVVPVDAFNEGSLRYAIDEIKKVARVDEVAVLRVTQHNPYPPHACHSYVTQAESNEVPEHSVEVGRRKFASPAENPWG